MLHTHNARKSFGMDVLENIFVVYFTSGRFISTRVVANLKITDFVPACIYVRDKVTFLDLLVVDIKKYLAGRAIHGLAYFEGLWTIR